MPRRSLVIVAAVVLWLVFAGGWATRRVDECELFEARLVAHISALKVEAVGSDHIAARSSVGLRHYQPTGCDIL